jgi:hypothetical protein
VSRLLYLVQTYLSGMAKAKPAFSELELPQRAARASDTDDLEALALAAAHCDLVACDAFMADVIRRTRLDRSHGCDVFAGRRPDVLRLRDRLEELARAA